MAFNESSPQWQTISFLLSDKRREWETGEEDADEEKWAPAEDLPQAIANLAALRRTAGANQIRTIYDRVSNQTGLAHPGLPNNPLIGVTDDMITAAYNAHHAHQAVKPPHLLMAIWKKEGADLHRDVLSAGASGINASSADNAKSIFRSYSYYVEMGMDEFIHFTPVPGGDNRTSFRDGDAASHETAFTNRIARLAADGYLAGNLADNVNGSLTVTPLAANRYAVAPNLHFYIYSLLLIDALFRDHEAQTARIPAVGPNPDIGLTYMRWNMGGRRMEEFIRSAERRRVRPENQANGNPISLVEWAFERVPRRGQWRDPRSNAIKLRYFDEIFQLVFS